MDKIYLNCADGSRIGLEGERSPRKEELVDEETGRPRMFRMVESGEAVTEYLEVEKADIGDSEVQAQWAEYKKRFRTNE